MLASASPRPGRCPMLARNVATGPIPLRRDAEFERIERAIDDDRRHEDGDQPEPRLASGFGHHVAAGAVILPPVIGRGTPVVPGKLIGSPARVRAARKPKHCASIASPSQPSASTGSTGTPSRSRSAAMIAGLCRPPPVTSQRSGVAGNGATATAAAVNATSVAAPSAGDRSSSPLAASEAAKSSRSSDFGGGREK